MARPAQKKLSTAPVSSGSHSLSAPEYRDARFQKDGEASHGAAGTELGITEHKPTKLTRHRVPPPQRVRIMQKYVAGESIVQISREEKRNRETVTKIVRSSEMQDFVRRMREEFYGLVFDAMKSVRFALQNNSDPRLAYKVLVDAGIIPSKEERAQATMQQVTPAVPALTQFQRTILGSAAIMEETCRVFGEPLPDVKEMEHNLRISREIDKMTGGKALQLSLNGPAEEWNRLKVLAEERLKKPS